MNYQEMLPMYQAYEKRLFAQALAFTHNEQDAEDLIQETSLRIFRQGNGFAAGTNFYAWAKTILRNIFINNYRRKNRLRDKLSTGMKATVWDQDSVVNHGEGNLQVEELLSLVDNLGQLYSVPFMMHYRGYAYQEIADALEAPIGTIKSRIFVARRKLQEQLIAYRN